MRFSKLVGKKSIKLVNLSSPKLRLIRPQPQRVMHIESFQPMSRKGTARTEERTPSPPPHKGVRAPCGSSLAALRQQLWRQATALEPRSRSLQGCPDHSVFAQVPVLSVSAQLTDSKDCSDMLDSISSPQSLAPANSVSWLCKLRVRLLPSPVAHCGRSGLSQAGVQGFFPS